MKAGHGLLEEMSGQKGGYRDVYYSQGKYSRENKFPYEGSYYRDYFRDIPFRKLKQLFLRKRIDLNDNTVLVASSGSGIDGHYLKKMFSSVRIFFSDINLWGMEKLRSNFPEEPAVLTDNCRLSFKNDSFDYAFIAASLHHLKEPVNGLYELLRVARRGVIVIEPNDSLLCRLFIKLGLAHEYEFEHGNYIFRFSGRDVSKISKALFYKYDYLRFFSTHKIANSKTVFTGLRLLNSLANLFLPWQGNYIVFLIEKESSRGK